MVLQKRTTLNNIYITVALAYRISSDKHPRRFLNFETEVWRLLQESASFKVREMKLEYVVKYLEYTTLIRGAALVKRDALISVWVPKDAARYFETQSLLEGMRY